MNTTLVKLPLEERIELVEDLWDSIAAADFRAKSRQGMNNSAKGSVKSFWIRCCARL